MNALKFTRYTEWWEYKLVPLISVGYATLLLTNADLKQSIWSLLILMCAIVTGAVYVSVINDITDIREDALAGKPNRMASLSPAVRTSLVCVCLLAGIYFGSRIYPDKWGLFFYIMAWIVFSLYSLPPFRLKKRGIWGVLCDASGAHLFPTLLISAHLLYLNYRPIDILWYISLGVWSLFNGLRGILWHQFYDRANDLRSGTATFATRLDPETFKTKALLITLAELAAFFVVICFVQSVWIWISLGLYSILLAIRAFAFKYETALIIISKTRPYQLLFNDFYLVFFPLALLVNLATADSFGWYIVFGHLVLFPAKFFLVCKDVVLFIRNSSVLMSFFKKK